MNKHLLGGVGIMILSIVLAIIMMATNGWIGNCNPGAKSDGNDACIHAGMRILTVDGMNGGSGRQFAFTSSDCKSYLGDDTCNRLEAGGTIIMATGIIAFVVFIVAVVLLCVGHRHGVSNYRYGALFGMYVTSGLMVLGIILYAYKMQAGFSFILMIIAGFMYFIGVGLVLGGGWKISLKEGAETNEQPKKKETTTETTTTKKKSTDEEAL